MSSSGALRGRGLSWGVLGGLVALALIAVLYPIIAERTAHPLAVFVLPILIVAALAPPRAVALVGGLSVVVALVEGAATSDLGRTPLAARVIIIVATAAAGVVLATIRHERERSLREADRTAELMDTFQRVLVPRPSPPAGFVVRTRYVPGEERLMLGGDFIDALDLPDGSLGFIVGDVCGNGPNAAALGAAIRAGWKTIATHAVDAPDTWVQVMDQAFFGHGRHDTYATVCTGRVTVDGRLQFVSCGHPWPIAVRREPEMIRPCVTRPLGVRRVELTVAVTEFELSGDDRLLIYTDGLIENRLRRPVASESDLLVHLRRNSSLDLDRLLEEFGPNGFSDDVAVMSISLAR